MSIRGFALLALVAIVIGTPATATIGTIQPGDQLNGGCTMSFVFDGVGALAGKVYISTVAHCVEGVGQVVDSAPYDDFGIVALVGSESTAATDWAFIEVKPEFHRFVKAAVKGHPAYPTGVATHADTFPGDLLQFSGYGAVFDATALTQEKRVAILTLHEEARMQFVGPGTAGDSGGPIVHVESGKALGLQSRVGVAGVYHDVLRQAALRGFTVELRTV